MQDYFIVIDILKEVMHGANLGENFNLLTKDIQDGNIGKVKDISYGVCRYYYQLKAIINQLVKKPNNDDTINILLLILFYELNYTKKPAYSVVNTIVELSYLILKNNQIKNFINAVARNYLRQKEQINNDIEKNYEVKYNLPRWWIDMMSKSNKVSLINKQVLTSNVLPKICLRVNKRKITTNKYQAILTKEQIKYNIIDGTIVLDTSMSISKIPHFNDGYVSIQNISAQQLIKFIPKNLSGRVLDACSAPGGKLTQLLENFDLTIDALDIDNERLRKISDNLSRLGLFANLYCVDASKPKWFLNKSYNLIIADVPCSASGTIKTNPDIKINRRITDINNFVQIQRQIFDNLLQFVVINGYIIYVTCSIFSLENQDNIAYFLDKYKNLIKIEEQIIAIDDVYDGFYYCVLQKI
jgi:16S rRNA (cytosine967-C5)-methyltransferase